MTLKVKTTSRGKAISKIQMTWKLKTTSKLKRKIIRLCPIPPRRCGYLYYLSSKLTLPYLYSSITRLRSSAVTPIESQNLSFQIKINKFHVAWAITKSKALSDLATLHERQNHWSMVKGGHLMWAKNQRDSSTTNENIEI